MQKFARIGDRVINLDLVTSVELEAESDDDPDADDPERLVVVHFASGSDDEGSPAVFAGEEAEILREWFGHDAFDIERAVRDQTEPTP